MISKCGIEVDLHPSTTVSLTFTREQIEHLLRSVYDNGDLLADVPLDELEMVVKLRKALHQAKRVIAW